MQVTPLTTWENSEEMNKVGIVMAKHRKVLLEKFALKSTNESPDGKTKYVTFH